MKQEYLEVKQLFFELMHEDARRVDPLPGGFTNTTYMIETADRCCAMRIPGIGTNEYIDREDEILNLRKLTSTGFVPNLLYSNTDTGIIISEYVEDSMPFVDQDIYVHEKLKSLCSTLHALHRSKIAFNNEFDIVAIKDSYRTILDEIKAKLPRKVVEAEKRLDPAVERLFIKYPKQLVPCHGDPKLNNFLFSKDCLYLIDWEYSGMADCYFDLVNLVMTNNLNSEQESLCLEMYEQCSGEKIIREKYLLYKVITDYLWLYWHLIKFNQGQMVDYNRKSWAHRLNRALENLNLVEGIE